MSQPPGRACVERAIVAAHEREWGRVLAIVAGVTRDLDAAEDAVQDAFAAAWRTWPRDGVPRNPGAWLTTAARNRALDQARRAASLAQRLPLLIVEGSPEPEADAGDDNEIPDERLRLIFTCCHPALSPEARVALTLRLVCGLATAEIAALFLVPEVTMAARITRAKRKIAAAGIPYRVPDRRELPERLPAVLAVIFLLFTEAHTASRGDALMRPDLARIAHDLVAVLRALLPDEPEPVGLAALMQLTDARRGARLDQDGALVLLEHQDRAAWDGTLIAEGIALVERALTMGRAPGPYALQAAIAAVHAEAPAYDATDWAQIVALYDVLLAVYPSPVAATGRAVALGMRDGPEAGLAALERLAGDGRLRGYAMLPAARADFLRRLGRHTEARAAYVVAARLSRNGVVQAFLNRRIAEMERLHRP